MRAGDLVKGVRAGGFSGLILGALSVPINYYLLAVKYRGEISEALGRPYYPSLEGLFLIGTLTALIFALCGALYAVSYERLPPRSPFWKAFIFGSFVFVGSRVGDLVVDYPLSRGLVLESATWSAPMCLLVWPYFTSRLYHRN
ncbi:MAG: hypothetical protein QI223_08455 [Candidatus Korarchaeota archaeon]|nr:hypothetical protein [Candidatus Korarchaeota archaeon]